MSPEQRLESGEGFMQQTAFDSKLHLCVHGTVRDGRELAKLLPCPKWKNALAREQERSPPDNFQGGFMVGIDAAVSPEGLV
jgi:hypothetical protein